ncbi:hypothetical protein JCM10908_002080 [Rhodotorula pacifica]|uniref:TRAPP subunit BET5 n=1 Tax=Rhodotorula pacifica TaxID=1495444 RepID=UPI00317AE33F
MTVYGLYIYDRHCTCCFYTDLGQRPPPVAGPSTLPKVLPPAPPPPQASAPPASIQSRDMAVDGRGTAAAGSGGYTVPDSATAGYSQQANTPTAIATGGTDPASRRATPGRLAFDEEAKLVYGVVFSLRNMVSQLSTRPDESFQALTTSAYKLHYLTTPSSFHFVLLTSPQSQSCRPLLRQIYTGPFNEYIVRNPLASLDTQKSGKGIDNQAFRRAVEKLLAAA